MQTFDTPGDARLGIMVFLVNAGADVPSALKGKAMDLVTRPAIEQIVQTAELLYANADDAGQAGRDLAGGLAGFCAKHNFHGLGGSGNRGGRIAAAMMRANGEKPVGIALGKAADDPAPLAEYAPPAAASA